MRLDDASFKLIGPPNIRQFYLGTPKSSILLALISFLLSSEFKFWLERLTGLELTQHPSSNQLRKFKPGNYTLIQDLCLEKYGLDINLDISPEETSKNGQCGGQIYYVSNEETLICQAPKHNCLNLVYRDPPTRKFVKYVNSSCCQEVRNDMDIVWTEQEDEA